MPWRASSGVQRLRSWLGPQRRSDRLRFRFHRRWFPLIPAVVGAVILFFVFVFPHLLRFRFRAGLSWYDLGIYGFGPTRSYVSFGEVSRRVEISPPNANCDPRYTFFSPRGDSVAHRGPMILDANGDLVWMKEEPNPVQNFQVQQYQGENYLTYWTGDETDGHGRGAYYMLDSSYEQKHVIRPVGDLDGDLHEFSITSNDTALITVYDSIPADLTSVGGPEHGWLYDGMVQEIDLATGELLFEWRSSSVYPPNSSYFPLGGKGYESKDGYDYIHINSVSKDDQGRFLISGRHTKSITCVDGATGEVLWILGGMYNEFSDASDDPATEFKWQHDARWQGPNSLTVFDNAANDDWDLSAVSRGLWIELDIPARQATMRGSYEHPQDMMAMSQGNVQVLDTGNVFVGWGHSAAYSEFTPNGELVCNVHYGASAYFTFGRIVSYRTYKGDWVGYPETLPDIAVAGDSAFVSWNGATEVAAWRLEMWDGASLHNLTFKAVDKVDRTTFETEIPLPSEVDSFLRACALDSDGEVLGITDVIQRRRPSTSEKFGRYLSLNWGFLITVLLALGCILFSIYFVLVSYTCCRRSESSGSYQLVLPKDDDENDSEQDQDRLPF